MILIVCVDEKNGMLFNNRRQSRDKKIIERIVEQTKNKKLWITSFSQELFNDSEANNLIIDDNIATKMGKEDYCFVENIEIKTIIEKIDKIILYNWNRSYPADRYLEINLEKWVVESEEEFAGHSHAKITQKIYIRGKK